MRLSHNGLGNHPQKNDFSNVQVTRGHLSSDRFSILKKSFLSLAITVFGMLASIGEEHTVEFKSATDGVALLRFVAYSNWFYRLETTSDLLVPFTPASALIKGSDQLISCSIYTKAPKPIIPPETELFTVYSFTNGQSLVVPQITNSTFGAALMSHDFRGLPLLYFQPATTNGGPLLIYRGELSWNPGYSNYNVLTLPIEEAAKVLRLTSRYQEITNALTHGGPIGWPNYGAGLSLSGENLFFRVSRFPADQDEDGLDWASEVFLTATSPLDADSNHNGISDGLEDQDGDHIPDADEIQFGLNPLFNETSTSIYVQRMIYDSLHRLRSLSSPGSVLWTLTPDPEGNITKAGQ